MHFVVMGCGRVGAAIAVELSARGHSVAIIDSNADAFRRLPEDFDGQRVTGLGFDRESLQQAGIEDAYGFAAVSSGDNSNIIAARVVRDTFGLSNVVTRIYDPSRARVYERLGVATVPTVRWAADQVMRRLIPSGPYREFTDSAAGIQLISVDLHESWYGVRVGVIESATQARVAYVVRHGDGLLPTESTIIQDGDRLTLLVETGHGDAIQRILSYPIEEKWQDA